MKVKSVKENYTYNLLYQIFALLTPLITTPYISRVLGAEGVGTFSYTYSLAQYCVLFGNLGIATYGQMAIACVRDNKKMLSKIFYELAILRTITILISMIVYSILSFLSSNYRQERITLNIFIFAAIFDFSWLFQGIESFSKVAVRNFILKLSTIIMIFTFVKKSDDIILYVLLVALSALLGNLSFLVSLKGLLVKVKLSELSFSGHLRQCIIFFIPTVATSVYTLLDKSMLGFLTHSTLENGYYEQAHRIEQILIVIITSYNTIMRSRMSYLFQNGYIDEMHIKLKQSINYILMISIPMFFGVVGIAPTFIPLFLGHEFKKSIVLLQIFSLLLIIVGLSNCLNTHFLGPSGRQNKNNVVLVMGAGVNFVCNMFLIPEYGALGAAVASIIAEFLILCGYMYLSRDFFNVYLLIKAGWKYIIAGSIMYMVIINTSEFSDSLFIKMICQIIFGICTYFISILILKDSFLLENIRKVLIYIKKEK